MTLKEVFALIADPWNDLVSVFDSTPTDFYHTLFEGVPGHCPNKLLERVVLEIYPASVLEDCGICIGLDGYDGMED